MTTIAQRVARGVALLDKTCPDWRARVDVRTLDMSSNVYGLLEQVYPDDRPFLSGTTFFHACSTLGIKIHDAGNYGFDIVTDDACEGRPQWDALTAAWKKTFEANVTQAS